MSSAPQRESESPSHADDRISPLLECIEELAPKAREVLRLRYFAEHGPGEIASLLGRTVAGVNATLVKSREALRQCLDRKLVSQDQTFRLGTDQINTDVGAIPRDVQEQSSGRRN